jgi:L-rhamnose mutarotase
MNNHLLKREVYKFQDRYYKKKYINAIKNDNINEAKILFERRKNVLFFIIEILEEMSELNYFNENEYLQTYNSGMSYYNSIQKTHNTLLRLGCKKFNYHYEIN